MDEEGAFGIDMAWGNLNLKVDIILVKKYPPQNTYAPYSLQASILLRIHCFKCVDHISLPVRMVSVLQPQRETRHAPFAKRTG